MGSAAWGQEGLKTSIRNEAEAVVTRTAGPTQVPLLNMSKGPLDGDAIS